MDLNRDVIRGLRARYPQPFVVAEWEPPLTAAEVRAFVQRVTDAVDHAQAQERAAAHERGGDAWIEYQHRTRGQEPARRREEGMEYDR